jgi:cyanophycinase
MAEPSPTLALVGAGEFLASMLPVDRELLARSGGNRVVVLPTASAPDGAGIPQRWATMGEDHFRALGARVDVVLALTRRDCELDTVAERIAAADLVYFSGGKPDYLYSALQGTPAWASVLTVLERGGVVAGCSAGAMILGAYLPVLRLRPHLGGGRFWSPAFGLVPDTVVIPHFNEIPRTLRRAWIALRPRHTRVAGIDRGTALVGRPGSWEVRGEGVVTVIDAGGERAYHAGEPVP